MNPLSITFDLEAAREAALQVTAWHGLEWEQHNQLSLTHHPDTVLLKVLDGIGRQTAPVTDYSVFNESLKDTYFYHIWQVMNEQIGICRVRLMRQRPGTCLSFHCDYEDRYHMAIETAPRAWILLSNQESYEFPDPQGHMVPGIDVFHVPADGRIYSLESTRYHTAVNASKKDRIHLVMSSQETDNESFVNRSH